MAEHRPDPSAVNRAALFSDGVFAIAITLLILEISIPETTSGSLGDQLSDRWPSYVAYAVSFLTVGICWINHHAQFALVERANRPLLLINLVLLMTVAFIPFPTAVMARFLNADVDAGLAVAFYSLALLAIDVAFFAHWYYPVRAGLWVRQPQKAEVRGMMLRNAAGAATHIAGAGVAFIDAHVGLAICALSGLHFLRAGPMAHEIVEGDLVAGAPEPADAASRSASIER